MIMRMAGKQLMDWLQIILLSWLLIIQLMSIAKANSVNRSRPCMERCGNIAIHYLFGMSEECYFNKWFQVTCDKFNKAFLSSIDLELLEIYPYPYRVRVNVPVISSNCGGNSSRSLVHRVVNLSGSPFTFSDTGNRFTAVSCNNYAEIKGPDDSTIGGCLSTCSSSTESVTKSNSADGIDCYGLNCCQTAIPPDLQFFNASVSNYGKTNNNFEAHEECRSAFMVDQKWFNREY